MERMERMDRILNPKSLPAEEGDGIVEAEHVVVVLNVVFVEQRVDVHHLRAPSRAARMSPSMGAHRMLGRPRQVEQLQFRNATGTLGAGWRRDDGGSEI